jgi:hypothetical protein
LAIGSSSDLDGWLYALESTLICTFRLQRQACGTSAVEFVATGPRCEN